MKHKNRFWNSSARNAEKGRHEILSKSSIEEVKVPPQIKERFNYIIETFFHGDIDLWTTRKTPYVFFKHMFRQYLYNELGGYTASARVEGVLCGHESHATSIRNSIEQDPETFNIHPQLLERIKDVFVKGQDTIKDKIIKRLSNGYTTDDIARHCVVHQSAIEDVLKDKQVPYLILKQIDKEL